MRASFILSEVFTGLRRNMTMTIAMIITTAISLGLFGGGLLVVQMTNKTQQIYLDRLEVQVFLDDVVSTSDPDCKDVICSALRTELENTDGVQSLTYVNRQQAYADYKRIFQSQPELVELTRQEALPASFKIKLSDPERFGIIKANFDQRPGIASVRDQQEVVDRLMAVLNGIRNAAFAIAVVQALGAILLIANMIQIAAFTRRAEVSIMRLVGATRWYTQLPFLLEAVVAALIGSVVAIIGLFAAKSLFIDDVLADLYSATLVGQITNSDVLLVSPVLVLVSAGLAAVTAYVTLRLYVRQ